MPDFKEEIHNVEELKKAIGWVVVDLRNIDMMPFLEDTIGKLETLHDNYFQSATGPGNRVWPELAPSTIARKGHAEILVDTGRLKSSLTSRTADSIRDAFQEEGHAWIHFGTEVEYSHYHDEDALRLPQRPHVGLSEPDLDGIAGQVLDYQVEEMVKLAK